MRRCSCIRSSHIWQKRESGVDDVQATKEGYQEEPQGQKKAQQDSEEDAG
jgi:hypothetical protein